jgi:hypothetical protein
MCRSLGEIQEMEIDGGVREGEREGEREIGRGRKEERERRGNKNK